MQKPEQHILSTSPLDTALVTEALHQNTAIDVIPFIETAPVTEAAVYNKIRGMEKDRVTIVFTSINAVESVEATVQQKVNWTIFCIGHATQKKVEQVFGKDCIAGTADDAAGLADNIISKRLIRKVVFFCGDQRRDDLPQKLKSHGIGVEEIVVYQTIQTPKQLTKTYDGILFFSPSSVHSLFSLNSLPQKTQLFAIGRTTAKAIKQYTSANVIIADLPGKESLVKKAMLYLSKSKTL